MSAIRIEGEPVAALEAPGTNRTLIFLDNTGGGNGIPSLKLADNSVVPIGTVSTARQIIAGAGLTGGGDLSADRTLNVIANVDGSIIVHADDVQVGILATDGQHGSRGNGTLHTAASGATLGFYNDEMAQDAVAAALTNTTTINITYNDPSNQLTANVNDGSIINAKLANMTAPAFKGRTTAGAGVPEDLTDVQATALLKLATASLKGLLSPADFAKLAGMYKDAVTDGGCDATGSVDCTAQIQALNDAMATGGIIFFPVGTFKIAGTVNITSSNLNIKGANRRASVLAASSATGDMFNVTGDAVIFENLRFSTIASNAALRTANYAVNLTSTSDSSGLRSCDILFMWSAIQSSGPLQFFDDVNIREYGANAINGACILINGGGDRAVHRLTTDNGVNQTGFAGIRVTECASLEMSDCNIIHATTCLALEPATGKTVPSVEAVNCFFDTSVKGMAITPAGTGVVYRSKFTNCWFGSHTTAGIEMNGTQWDGITFSNCDFYGNATGISVPTGGGKWTIADSRFAGNTTAAISLTASAAHFPKIIGNDIGPQSAFAANAIGITIAAGTYKGLKITDNSVIGNTTDFVMGAVASAAGDESNFSILGNAGINPYTGTPDVALPATITAATPGTTVAWTKLKMPTGAFQVGTTVRWILALSKTAAGITARILATIRCGTTGTSADAAISVMPSTTPTAVVDTGFLKILWTCTAVGASATGYASFSFQRALLTTGFSSVASTPVAGTPTTFNSTTAGLFLSIAIIAGGETIQVGSGLPEILKIGSP